MPLEFKMPDLATTDSEIRVIRWLVAEGDVIKRGQPILEVETDKAAMEVESIAAGTLRAMHAKAGDAVVGGQLIATIETAAAATSPPPMEDSGRKIPEPTATHEVARAASSIRNPESSIAAPRAASGMFAKNRAAAVKPPASAAAPIALTATQRTVARRMQESKQAAPHFYLQASVNAEPMIRRRVAAEPAKLAWDAFFAWAIARALKKFPRLACRFEADQLKPAASRDVGVAVDHDGELYVVTLAAPDTKSPEQLSAELRAQVAKVRAGDPEARKLRPAAMTVTNLGATRVEAFTAIVNPGEAAILAIGRVTPVAVVEADGVVAQPRLTVTLSVDHRVANGKYAADFLTEVVRELETL